MKEGFWTIHYQHHQSSDGEIVLVKDIPYELKMDSLTNRYFVVNMNHNLIYLDQFKEEAIVKECVNNTYKGVDFSKEKRDSCSEKKRKRSFFY